MSILKHRGKQIFSEFGELKDPKMRQWASLYASYEASGSKHWLTQLNPNLQSERVIALSREVNNTLWKMRHDAMKTADYTYAEEVMNPTDALIGRLDQPRDQLYEGFGQAGRKFEIADKVMIAINRHVLCGYIGRVIGFRPDGKLIVSVPNKENVVNFHASSNELIGVHNERVSPRKVLQPVGPKRPALDFNDTNRQSRALAPVSARS